MAPTQQRHITQYLRSKFLRSRLALCIAAQCAGILLFANPALGADPATNTDPNEELRELDWVPLEELTAEQKAQVPTACCGAYVAPERDDAESEMDPEKANIFGTADYSESEKQTKFIMRDDVRLTQGRRSFRADTFTFDKTSREAELDGNIQVREPGVLLRADRAYIDTNTGDARLDNARFVLYETRVRGRAENLQKFGDKIISLDQGTFTSCEPGDNTWAIKGSNITLHNDKHYGTAKHMRLHIKDIPVAYAPYFRFPIGPDRLTGFLFPSVGFDENDGIGEFSAPFYWNIAPNYDATFTPRYLSEHGYMLATEFRHKSTWFDTELSGSVLNNDRSGDTGRADDEIDARYLGKDRWQYNVLQTGGRNQPWSTEIDYTDVSDADYLRDVDGSAVDLNRQAYIRQRAAASFNTGHWQVGAKAEEFRLLTSTQLPYRELPRLHADGQYRINDWQIELDHEFTNFAMNRYFEEDPANALYKADLITGERLRTNYKLTWDKEFTAGYLKPGIGVKTLGYKLEATNLRDDIDSSQQFAAPQGSLDMGLYFEREKSLFGSGFTQTLEPRAFYLYRDYENQDSLYGLTSASSYVNFDTSDLVFTYEQLFRDSRFSGGDRIDDTNHLALGLTSRFVEDGSGIERLRLSVGQITYFEDREVSILNDDDAYANTRTSSAVAGQLSAQLGDHLRINNDVLYDHQQEKINTVSTSLHYMDEQYRILNVGYRYSRDPVSLSPLETVPAIGKSLNQLDVTTLWPVSNQWALIARANYDFTYNAELDTFAGLEYTDCCYRVRVLARQWVDFDFSPDFMEGLSSDDYDRGVFIEVQLRGFGSLSQRISNLLDKAMYGYGEREKSLQ
ncbi:LPS-assembly protein LptD [Cellvibrio sp. pealriver]|uniref:LPS-assembly protein LptD n=1 Tax=Cellvibrio sp. pealriver TaxID=1622269 RepID=UPI00066FC639|nr:LPS-assembly protein LptD [Cellvibrio sp. pealriver]